MRRVLSIATVLDLLLLHSSIASAQSVRSPAPRQALNPEQAEDRRQIDGFLAERTRLSTAAKQALAAEMVREKAGDCKGAASTYEATTCLSSEEKITEANYTLIVVDLRALLALPSPFSSGLPAPGPTGVPLTEAQEASEFDRLQQSWESYSKVADAVAFAQFRGGTEALVSRALASLMLVRSHMKELASLYDAELGNH